VKVMFHEKIDHKSYKNATSVVRVMMPHLKGDGDATPA